MRKVLLLIFMISGFAALAQPAIQQPSDYTMCRDLSDDLSHFDLSSKNEEILEGLNAALYNVGYFDSQDDAVSNSNALQLQYNTNSYSKLIFVRVTEIATGLYATTSFSLHSTGGNSTNDLPNLIIYEEVFDGVASFNLQGQVALVSNNEPPSQDIISFYVSENDAIQGVNPIDVSVPYLNVSNPQTIWAKVVVTFTGCPNKLQPFQLIVGNGIEPVLIIPDQNFKNKLLQSDTTNNFARAVDFTSLKIDANGDGEIQVSEAQYLAQLNIASSNIGSLSGITGFSNLTSLSFNDNNLGNVNLTGLDKLRHLFCKNNQLTSLDISVLPNLYSLDCSNNQLVSLSGFNQGFGDLFCNGNPLTSLDLSGNTNLRNFSCSNTLLSSLDISSKPTFEGLVCKNTPLTSIHLEDLATMWFFEIENTQLTEINFSNVPSIEAVFITDNPVLTSINLKNGAVILSPDQCIFSDNPNLAYICVDEGEQAALLEYAEYSQLSPDVFMNTLCDETGGNFNTIAGNISFDVANNGCGEGALSANFVSVSVTNGSQANSAYANFSGAYSFPVETGTFTLTPHFENDWFTATPASATVTATIGDTAPSVQDFCITSNGSHPDTEVVLVPLVPAQPGFDAVYSVVLKNKGNQVLNGDVKLQFDDAIMDYISASLAPSSVVPHMLTWAYTNLLPFENRKIQVVFNINSPMESPAVNIDDVAGFTVAAAGTSDETPLDNQFTLNQVIVGSFDPNDITCLEGESVTPDKIGEYLHYNINFENTGTAPATFIVVKDTIDQSQFDIATLQFLNASHNVAVKVEGNVAEFRFDAINLGPNEKGNIVLKIKTLNSLIENDAVSHKAEIFFDYNFPILTNDAVTTFETLLGTGDFIADNAVKVYPNPAKDVVNITAGAEIRSISIYDIQSRLLQTVITDQSSVALDMAKRAAGIYFLKIITDKGTKVQKLIKQ